MSTRRRRTGVLWEGDAPYMLAPGPIVTPGGPPLFFVVDATVVVDDGRIYGTCIQYAAYGQPLACRWTGPGQVVVFPSSYVFEADETGHRSGQIVPARTGPFIAPATFDDVVLPFPVGTYCPPFGACEAEARDFSVGGAVVVGTANLPQPGPPNGMPVYIESAFVYTTAEGMVRLPDLTGGEDASGAFAITPDARVIGGYGTGAMGREAVVWIDRAPRSLEDVFVEAGGELPEGFILHDVRAIADDGRVIVGNGINPSGDPEGFRIVLPTAL
jgi:hypothetical protein